MAKKGKQKPPADETPEQRFQRLAGMRVNKALKAIQLTGNLAGPAYKYTQDQVSKILGALRNEVNALESRFKGVTQKQLFSL